jgi:MFS family permease
VLLRCLLGLLPVLVWHAQCAWHTDRSPSQRYSNEAMPKVKRLLIPSAALLWGLQFAFLNPALALLLVALFDATAAEVGWVLAVYNGSGFIASLVLPSYADRKGNYLWPLLACGVLTLALAVLLFCHHVLPGRCHRPAGVRWASRGR